MSSDVLAFWCLVLAGILSVQWLWAMSGAGAVDVATARRWFAKGRWPTVLDVGPHTVLGELADTVAAPNAASPVLVVATSGNCARRWAGRLRAIAHPDVVIEYFVGRTTQFPWPL